MIVLFLSGMVAMIMMRTLHRDFNRYNATEAAEDVEEETGWKLVHGDGYAAAPPRRRPAPPPPRPSRPRRAVAQGDRACCRAPPPLRSSAPALCTSAPAYNLLALVLGNIAFATVVCRSSSMVRT